MQVRYKENISLNFTDKDHCMMPASKLATVSIILFLSINSSLNFHTLQQIQLTNSTLEIKTWEHNHDL